MLKRDFSTHDLAEFKLLFLRELNEGYHSARGAHDRYRKDVKDQAAVEELAGFFHRIAGTAQVVNLPALGYTASMSERIANQILDEDSPDPREAEELFAEALAVVASVLDDHCVGITGLAPPAGRPNENEAALDSDSLKQGHEVSKVLVIDDDPVSAGMTATCLRSACFRSSVCCDPRHALEAIEKELPDLIILDVIMPGIDGFEVCRKVRQHPALRCTPIIFVTRKGEVEDRIQGLDAGGNDYITKPFEPHELVARVRTHLNRLASLREMAVRDGLTLCFNHRYFRLRLAQEISRACRYDYPLSVAMVDVDNFKGVNDTYGHPFGDTVLADIANIIVDGLRTSDVVARYGGEEFAVLMPHTRGTEAEAVCHRLRKKIAEHRFQFTRTEDRQATDIPVTASIGVADLTSETSTVESLLADADKALYMAKEGGRNRVVSARPGPPAERRAG